MMIYLVAWIWSDDDEPDYDVYSSREGAIDTTAKKIKDENTYAHPRDRWARIESEGRYPGGEFARWVSNRGNVIIYEIEPIDEATTEEVAS